jgi:hypothetical protein
MDRRVDGQEARRPGGQEGRCFENPPLLLLLPFLPRCFCPPLSHSPQGSGRMRERGGQVGEDLVEEGGGRDEELEGLGVGSRRGWRRQGGWGGGGGVRGDFDHPRSSEQ